MDALGSHALGVHALGGASDSPVTNVAGTLAFSLTIQSAGLRATRRMTADALAFTYTLNSVTFRRGFALVAEPLHFNLTINEAGLLTTQPYLPAASAGLNYTFYVRSEVNRKARSGDTIYDGASTGTMLHSADANAILKLIATDSGKWFILNKTGEWTLN